MSCICAMAYNMKFIRNSATMVRLHMQIQYLSQFFFSNHSGAFLFEVMTRSTFEAIRDPVQQLVSKKKWGGLFFRRWAYFRVSTVHAYCQLTNLQLNSSCQNMEIACSIVNSPNVQNECWWTNQQVSSTGCRRCSWQRGEKKFTGENTCIIMP